MIAKTRDVFQWVRLARDATVTGARKSVLFALASRADESGECFPSIGRLAHDAGVSDRGAQKAVRALVAEGWIAVREGRRRGTKRRGANVYRIQSRGEPGAPRSSEGLSQSRGEPRSPVG